MMKTIQETVVDEVISWRRHFHENPELSYQEHQTSEFIYRKLKTFTGLEVTRPTETSVLAVLKGAKNHPENRIPFLFVQILMHSRLKRKQILNINQKILGLCMHADMMHMLRCY